MLSPEEVKALILEKFADVVATKNKGMIMKNVMGELKGKADGKVINHFIGTSKPCTGSIEEEIESRAHFQHILND